MATSRGASTPGSAASTPSGHPAAPATELSDDAFFDKLMARCLEIQREKQAEYKRTNRRFMGLKKVAKARRWRSAKHWEDRFAQVPTVAPSQTSKRIAELRRNAAWREEYARQRDNLRTGRPTLLPVGAYLLPRLYNVPVVKPP